MKRIAIGMFLALAAMSAACGKKETGPLVLVIPRATDGQFWRTVRAGSSQAAKDQDAYLEWPSDFKPDDIQGQASVLRSARMRARVEGRNYVFAFAPVWGVGFRTLIKGWEQSDFRIDTFDEELTQHDDGVVAERPDADSVMQCPEDFGGLAPASAELLALRNAGRFVEHVGTLNECAGRAGANVLLAQLQQKNLGRRANVAILRLNPLSGSTTAREHGFLGVMAQPANEAIASIVSRDHYALGVGIESSFQEGLAMIDEMLKQDTPIDAVFCPNESTTTGMLRALENRGLAGKVLFVGFDQSPILATALWKGWIHALVLQDPYTMGYKSVRRALDVLKMTKDEYASKVARADFSMNVTQHRVVELAGLEKCQRYAESKGLGTLTGRKLADALLADERANESKCLNDNGANCHPMFYTNIDERSKDMGEPGCNLNVLDLLYPPVEIWHLASPGRAVK